MNLKTLFCLLSIPLVGCSKSVDSNTSNVNINIKEHDRVIEFYSDGLIKKFVEIDRLHYSENGDYRYGYGYPVDITSGIKGNKKVYFEVPYNSTTYVYYTEPKNNKGK